MKRSILSKLIAVSALSLTVLGSPALAQRGQKNGGGFPGFGGQGMPSMSSLMKMAGRSRMIEPTYSNIMVLLNRSDVRGELGLSAKQKEDLDGQQEQTMQTMIGSIMSKVMERMSDFQTLKDLPEADRKEKMQTFQNEMRGTVESSVKDADKDYEKILTKKQLKRLRELDLQWRSALAIADPTISESLKVTPEQKPEIDKIVAEYRETQQKQMQGAFGGMGAFGGPGAGAPGAPDMSAMQEKMEVIRKEQDKIREEKGKKLIALLTDTQKAEWTKMQGIKFKFRPNDD